MIAIYVVILLCSFLQQEWHAWHGIVPLRSTRTDVEQLLGQPTADTKGLFAAEYKTRDERVFVRYSSGNCDVQPNSGWNAARGTVIEIAVEPNLKPKFADLNLDKSKYEIIRDPEVLDFTYYTNETDGISFQVNTSTGLVSTFRYSPMSKDKYLRCPTPQPRL